MGRGKWRWLWVAAGYAVLMAIVAALTGLIYDAAASSIQPFVLRLGVAFVTGAIVIHLLVYFRGDPGWEPPSALEEALLRHPTPPQLHPGFVKIREEVARGLANRSHFEKVLWPRLAKLAESRGKGELPIPSERRPLDRGPSHRALAELIGHIEGRR
jgi:hypothetical protein